MPDFPSVGLRVDLGEIIAAKANLSSMTGVYNDLGDAADRAARSINAGIVSTKANASAAAAASASVASNSASSAAAVVNSEKKVQAAVGQTEKAVKQVGITTLQIREPIVLVREAIRGDFTRMAGSATLLLQAFGLITPATLAMAGAITVLAAPFVLLGLAMEQGAEQQAKLNNQLALTGDFAGRTADQVQDAAQRVATATNTGVSQAKGVFLALVSSGQVAGQTMDLMADASVRLSARTGESATKIAAAFVKIIDDPVRGFEILDKQYNFLSEKQAEHIRLLVEEGDKSGAAAEGMKIFDDRLKSETEHLTSFQSAMRSLINTLDELWSKLQNLGHSSSLAAEVASDQAYLARVKAGTAPNDPSTVAITKARIADDTAEINREAATAAQSQRDRAAKDAALDLDAQLTGLKTNREKVEAEVLRSQHSVDVLLGNPAKGIPAPTAGSIGAEALAEAQWARAHPDLVRQRIEKKYAGGADPHTGSMAGAINSVAKLSAEVTGLNSQIDNLSTDPFSEFASKITKAGEAAAAQRTAGKGAGFADQASDLAQMKEEATIALALDTALAKATRTELDRADSIKVAMASEALGTQAMLAYYTSGKTGAEDYAAALALQEQAQVDNLKAQAMLSIEQQNGVKSLDDIASHYLASLPPAVAATDQAKKHAAQLQAEAKGLYDATANTIDLTEAQKKQADADSTHLAAVRDASDTTAYAVALAKGSQALAIYNQQLAIRNALDHHVDLATATTDVQAKATADLQAARAKDTSDLTEQLRLATLTTSQREIETDVLARMKLLQADNTALTDQQARALATSELSYLKMNKDAAQLKVTIQDSIKSAFVDNGTLDFSSLGQGVLKELRKRIYEAFLERPIDIVINAVVDFETQALQSAIGSIFKSLNGGGSGGNFLSSLFGGGGGGASGFGGSSLGGELSDAASGLGKAASSLSAFAAAAGPVAAVAALGFSLGGPIAKLFGADKQQQQNASIGAALGGIVGGLLGVIFGGKESNHGAIANFDSSGNFVGVTGDKRTADTTNAVTSVAQSVATEIANLKQVGINAANIIKSIDLGTRDPTHINLVNGQTINTTMGDAAALQDGIEKALLQNATYTNAQEQKLVDQLLSANATLDEINTALQGFTQAQTDFQSVTLGLLKYTDPAAYATKSLQAQQLARRTTLKQEIAAGYFTQDQINQLAQTLPQLEQKEIADALAGVATSAGDAAHSLADFAAEQAKLKDFVASLSAGALSPLSPADQLAAQRAIYQQQLASAQGGNFTALQGISGTAQTYLQQAQQYFGSGAAYAQVFQDVTASLTALAGQGGATGADPQVDAINQANQDLQAAIAAGSLQIVAAIANNDNGPTSTGSTAANNNGALLTQDQINQITAALAASTEAMAGVNSAGLNGIANTIGNATTLAVAFGGGGNAMLA